MSLETTPIKKDPSVARPTCGGMEVKLTFSKAKKSMWALLGRLEGCACGNGDPPDTATGVARSRDETGLVQWRTS
jgi:hypothetical protein